MASAIKNSPGNLPGAPLNQPSYGSGTIRCTRRARDLQRGKFVHYFLLLLQRKVIKEKESGKDNWDCFSPIAHCLFPLQKTDPVGTFSGLADALTN